MVHRVRAAAAVHDPASPQDGGPARERPQVSEPVDRLCPTLRAISGREEVRGQSRRAHSADTPGHTLGSRKE